MTQKTFCLIAGILFTIIALVHLCRVVQGWDAVINGYTVPMWASWAGLIVTGILGFFGLRFGMGKP